MTPKQEEALRDYLQEAIVPLIEEVLVKKLGQAMSFAASELVPPQRTWVGLTDEDCKGMSAGDKVVAMWVDRTLKEKNNG